MIKQYYIFIEGVIDKIFMTKLFGERLTLLGSDYISVEYSTMSKKKIKSYINTINQVEAWDYIFLADQDGNEKKAQTLLDTYPFLDKDKVFISIFEIESWIISGISKQNIKKYKLKPIIYNTSLITKEKFDKMIPANLHKIEFISYILDDYNIEEAIERNESLKKIYTYLANKKAS